MTSSQRSYITQWSERAIIPVVFVLVGMCYMWAAASVYGDAVESAAKAAGTIDKAIEVAAGKSVLWLALAGATLSGIGNIALIVVMFKVVSKGIEVIGQLRDEVRDRFR